eukprot:GHVU01181436.1.p1 GENE.GHVU01181436.1~~GHVU01181436.1.p1  ORF type:complete len:352 (+),score=67.33 GHVU01181436.1:949-2004(+)
MKKSVTRTEDKRRTGHESRIPGLPFCPTWLPNEDTKALEAGSSQAAERGVPPPLHEGHGPDMLHDHYAGVRQTMVDMAIAGELKILALEEDEKGEDGKEKHKPPTGFPIFYTDIPVPPGVPAKAPDVNQSTSGQPGGGDKKGQEAEGEEESGSPRGSRSAAKFLQVPRTKAGPGGVVEGGGGEGGARGGGVTVRSDARSRTARSTYQSTGHGGASSLGEGYGRFKRNFVSFIDQLLDEEEDNTPAQWELDYHAWPAEATTYTKLPRNFARMRNKLEASRQRMNRQVVANRANIEHMRKKLAQELNRDDPFLQFKVARDFISGQGLSVVVNREIWDSRMRNRKRSSPHEGVL